MAFKEFAVKQGVKVVSPLVGKLSDRNLGILFWLAKRVAPSSYAKSAITNMDRLRKEHSPIIELARKAIRQTNPHVREGLINSLLIKHHWYGSIRRDEMRRQGQAVPGTFLISPTMRCNLRCTGCYAANYSKEDDLEFEVIDRVLTEAEELGIFFVTILGGEPFVRDDMWEIYKRHSDIFFHVYTNGTLVNKETAKKLAELGNIVVAFSIEGFEEETDARRGKGVFQKVMQGMDNLREAGVPFGFSSTVTRYNINTLISDEFNDMLVEKGCLFGWHFLYLPVGQNPDTSLMPTPEQRELLRLRGGRHIRSKKPMFVIDFWNDAPHMGGCIAGGRHFFHINSHGDVEPCVFIHLATDNIHEKSLREVINSPFFTGIRSRQPYSQNLLRPCTMIDHPQVLQDLCSEFHPHPTDGSQCSIITHPVYDALGEYSQEVAKIMDPVWEREFAVKHFKADAFAPGKTDESLAKREP